MGVEGVVSGLFGLASAGISAASRAHVQSAQASAQANLNKKTMDFNRKEAEKARNFTASQSSIERNYNSREALAARSFTAAQARQMMDFNSYEANLAREFNAGEALKARTFDAQQSYLARQFEERMSSTAHQREVQDLRKAGLNPILSATGGNGASTPAAPIIGSPMATSPMASGVLGSSAQASHSGSGSVAASIGALQALKKGDMMGSFMSSALDLVKANTELTRAKADDKRADAYVKESIQRVEESISRVGLNYDEHELNQIRKLSEEERVKLVREQITSEIIKRQDGHELSLAQKEAVEISSVAYAGLCGAQAGLASIRGQLETERNPAIIRELLKKADEYESNIKKNNWIMTDPEEINRRKFHAGNESAAGVEFASKVIGNVVHGAISFGSHSVTKGR